GGRGLALTYQAAVILAIGLPFFATAQALLPSACADGLELKGGQCVGMTASVESFDPFLAPLLARIDRQNKAIHQDARTFTVVYFGPLTQRAATTDVSPLVGAAGELVGIAARQAGYNMLGDLPKMRVEFANTGQDYVYAVTAAQHVKRRAVEDETFAAVIGLGWSRTEVRDAIGVLGPAQLPMVGTTSTADNLTTVPGGSSAWFFRLPAANSRQARATVEWITKLGVPAAGGRRFRGEQVAVIYQVAPHELYSADLTDRFLRLLPGVSEYRFSDGTTLTQAVRNACEHGSELIYFAGRSPQLATLTDAWRGHCADRRVLVMASDDVTSDITKEIREHGPDHGLDIFLVALTDPRGEVKAGADDREAKSGHRAVLDGWVEKSKADEVALPYYAAGNAALGYDAALVVTEALDDFLAMGDFQKTWGATPVRTGVHYNLRGLSVVGATGKITFSADAKGHDALDRQVWLVGIEKGENFAVHHVCTPTDDAAACARPK
ncbi:hypothetical protein C1I98_20125, partial [Spongiactinospora gelatinilytica]